MTKANGFLSLDHNFIRSEIVADLSPRAKLLIFGMADRYNGKNNGQIIYSIRDAMRWLRCSARTAIHALKELQDAGLIEATVRGSFDHANGRRKGMATKWRLTFLREKGHLLKAV
jgi:hypothetical protein